VKQQRGVAQPSHTVGLCRQLGDIKYDFGGYGLSVEVIPVGRPAGGSQLKKVGEHLWMVDQMVRCVEEISHKRILHITNMFTSCLLNGISRENRLMWDLLYVEELCGD
jgi:hypothetical protein